MTLHEVGLKYGTDKAVDHNFLNAYEGFFDACNFEPKTIVEVGIWRGESLRMWSEYFPVANIIGLDINKNLFFSTEKITCTFADQSNVATITPFAAIADLFVDDGSHQWSHQIKTFEAVWPLLSTGSIYIMEDLHTSNMPSYKDCNTQPLKFICNFAQENAIKSLLIRNNTGNSISMIMQK